MNRITGNARQQVGLPLFASEHIVKFLTISPDAKTAVTVFLREILGVLNKT